MHIRPLHGSEMTSTMSNSRRTVLLYLILLVSCETDITIAGSLAAEGNGKREKGTDFANLTENSQNCITKSMEILRADAKRHRDNIWTFDIDSNATLRSRVQRYYDSFSKDSQGEANNSFQYGSKCRSAESIWLRVSLAHFASEPATIRVEELLEKINTSSNEGTIDAKVGSFIHPETKFLGKIESVSKSMKDIQQHFPSTAQPKSRRIDPKNTGDFYAL